jgi:hypothetical protein
VKLVRILLGRRLFLRTSSVHGAWLVSGSDHSGPGTKIAASMMVLLFAVSTVGAGLYLSARPSGPSCSNRALNYPSCNTCGSRETYSLSTNWCVCANGAVNAPSCNRRCANNALNPPQGGNPRACDLCPDNQTDVVCSPGLPPETYSAMNNDHLGYPRS